MIHTGVSDGSGENLTGGPGDPARAAGAEAWLAVSDGLLRGLTHALSNRVATLAALAGALEPVGEPDEPAAADAADPALLRALGDEVRRMGDLLRLLRMLPDASRGTAEPVRVEELLPEVIALHHHHADLREVECDLAGDPGVLPLLLPESALTHALLALLTAAKSGAAAAGTPVRLGYAGDERVVTVTVEADARAEAEHGAAAAAARWALAGWGAELDASAPGAAALRFELRLPTLPEVRRREAADPAADSRR